MTASPCQSPCPGQQQRTSSHPSCPPSSHTPTEPVRVVLCDDDHIYLIGLRTLLSRQPEIEVVAALSSTDDLHQLVELRQVQVVVVRHGLLAGPDYGPLHDLVRRGAAVLVLADSDSQLELRRALRAGARGYLSRALSGAQLLDGIRALARDEVAFDLDVARLLVASVLDDPPGSPPAPNLPGQALDSLTRRQRDVARLVAEGLSNREIAAHLHVEGATVKSHLSSAMQRLGLRSRTQLAVLVQRETAGQGRASSGLG